MIFLKHRDASGRLGCMWEFDALTHSVCIHIDGCMLKIPVCSEGKPKNGYFSLSRKGEDCWQIAPSQYLKRYAAWMAFPASFDPAGKFKTFFILTHATNTASEGLAEL